MKEILTITLLVGIARSQSIWDSIRIPFLPSKHPEKSFSVPLSLIFKPVADFFTRIGLLFRLSLGI